jgi:hypothetical protein
MQVVTIFVKEKREKKMLYKEMRIASGKGWSLSQGVSGIGKVIGLGNYDQRLLHMEKGWESKTEYTRYKTAIQSMGMCMFCSEIDFAVLQQHHVFGRKFDDMKVTLCANCHERLHYYLGGRREKWYGEIS